MVSLPGTASTVVRTRYSTLLSFVVWPLCFFLYLFLDATHGIKFWDEAWFLQVANRMVSGDVLYRDIFFGATPLSMYLTALFIGVFGVEVLVLKSVMALIYVATAMMSARLLSQVRPCWGYPFSLAIAILIIAPPWYLPTPYSPLANLFFLCCFSLSVMFLQRAEKAVAVNRPALDFILPALSGGAAALAFVSKQNIGVCALVVFLAGAVISLRGDYYFWRKMSVASLVMFSSFVLISSLALLPIWLSGGWQQFLDYGFFNKTTYLRFAKVPYFEGFMQLFGTGISLRSIPKLIPVALFLLPVVVFVGLMASLVRRPDKRPMTALLLVCVTAALVGIYPRYDVVHLAYIAPELLIAFAYSWHMIISIPERYVDVLRKGIGLLLAGGMSLMLAKSMAVTMSGSHHLSDLPHFRWVFLNDNARHEIMQAVTPLLETAKRGESPFLLSPRAGFFYLASGARNPTPYDFPLTTALGRLGEAQLIDDIGRGRLKGVWLDKQLLTGPLRPVKLVGHIRANLAAGERHGPFIEYH